MNKIKQYYLGLKFVFSYFTIFPISFKKDDDLSKKYILNSMLFFLPFLGFVLGVIVIVLYGFLNNLTWLGALISSIVYMLMYGFIHTEAILDTIDGIYAKHGGKDAYAVIKEPSIGAMGVLYALVSVILKLALIVFLLLNNLFFEFIFILVVSRLMLLFLIRFNTFKSSFVILLKNSLSLNSLLFSSIFTIIIGFILIGFKSLVLLFFAFCSSLIISKFIKNNLGFLNGDSLGMTLELTEIILFIVVCILWL